MKFHLERGQMRARKDSSGIMKMQYIPKSPKGSLMMAGVKMVGLNSGKSVEYTTDKIGNINIKASEHIQVMIGLGYPIYDGDGKQHPVPMDDLLYPTLEPNSSYWQRINEALHTRR